MPKSMSVKKKESNSTRKKRVLKPKHRRHIANFAKTAHALGANVKKHVSDLEIEEAELTALEKETGKIPGINATDKKKLQDLLEDLRKFAEDFVAIDEAIWSDVKKFTNSARKIQFFAYLDKTTVLRIEARILESVYHEHQKVFKQYPKLLASAEKCCSSLLRLEGRIKTKRKALPLIKGVNANLRRVLNEDVYGVSKDILQVYTTRLKVFDKLLRSAELKYTDIAPRLTQERKQLSAVNRHYLNTYKKHTRKIREIYAGGAV